MPIYQMMFLYPYYKLIFDDGELQDKFGIKTLLDAFQRNELQDDALKHTAEELNKLFEYYRESRDSFRDYEAELKDQYRALTGEDLKDDEIMLADLEREYDKLQETESMGQLAGVIEQNQQNCKMAIEDTINSIRNSLKNMNSDEPAYKKLSQAADYLTVKLQDHYTADDLKAKTENKWNFSPELFPEETAGRALKNRLQSLSEKLGTIGKIGFDSDEFKEFKTALQKAAESGAKADLDALWDKADFYADKKRANGKEPYTQNGRDRLAIADEVKALLPVAAQEKVNAKPVFENAGVRWASRVRSENEILLSGKAPKADFVKAAAKRTAEEVIRKRLQCEPSEKAELLEKFSEKLRRSMMKTDYAELRRAFESAETDEEVRLERGLEELENRFGPKITIERSIPKGLRGKNNAVTEVRLDEIDRRERAGGEKAAEALKARFRRSGTLDDVCDGTEEKAARDIVYYSFLQEEDKEYFRLDSKAAQSFFESLEPMVSALVPRTATRKDVLRLIGLKPHEMFGEYLKQLQENGEKDLQMRYAADYEVRNAVADKLICAGYGDMSGEAQKAYMKAALGKLDRARAEQMKTPAFYEAYMDAQGKRAAETLKRADKEGLELMRKAGAGYSLDAALEERELNQTICLAAADLLLAASLRGQTPDERIKMQESLEAGRYEKTRAELMDTPAFKELCRNPLALCQSLQKDSESHLLGAQLMQKMGAIRSRPFEQAKKASSEAGLAGKNHAVQAAGEARHKNDVKEKDALYKKIP